MQPLIFPTASTRVCNDSDIRLVNSDGEESSGPSGIIEVCYTGIWGTVCVEEWDEVDALVACKQLTYTGLG